MKKIAKLIFIPMVALALGSCGGTAVGPTAASGSVTTTAQATALKTGFDTMISNLSATNLQSPGNLTNVPGVTTSAIKSSATSPYDACTTITPATAVDADGDGIAASKKYVYNCYGVTLPGHDPEDRVGYMEIIDDDTVSSGDGGAYSFIYDLSFSSRRYQSAWQGEYSLTRPQNHMVFTSKFKGHFSEDNSGKVEASTHDSNFVYDMVPTNLAMPWNAGTVTMNGYFGFTYKSDTHNPPLDLAVVWEVTAELEYENTGSSGCSQYYKSGYFQFKDAGNNSIRYDYTCSGVTYSLNGTVIP